MMLAKQNDPHHYALLDKIKPTEEMEKFRNEYYMKEVFEK